MKIVITVLLLIVASNLFAQDISNNRNPIGLEHNILFGATKRYSVSQTGVAKVDLECMFDGRFYPSYTNNTVSPDDPTVILIEGLPALHTQGGAWIGWSTRWWSSNHFLIEGYNVQNGVNQWVVISDYRTESNGNMEFLAKVPGGNYTKLRFTFYSARGDNGRMGISELYYIHPEATIPYYGLPNCWGWSGDNLYRTIGKVGIGTRSPEYLLDVLGTMRAREIKVDLNGGADFVFEDDYDLKSLDEVDQFIKERKHLPGIPSAKQMEKDGVGLAEMNKLLLQKVEELTLHLIDQKKDIEALKKENKEQSKEIESLKNNQTFSPVSE
ncbi:hypothetical protein EYV94_27920 [Puteibacter caeruleilacunae]|nr:hypothetical protein EYV94_27920 [Puteibacter caeruleilacunae]